MKNFLNFIAYAILGLALYLINQRVNFLEERLLETAEDLQQLKIEVIQNAFNTNQMRQSRYERLDVSAPINILVVKSTDGFWYSLSINKDGRSYTKKLPTYKP